MGDDGGNGGDDGGVGGEEGGSESGGSKRGWDVEGGW